MLWATSIRPCLRVARPYRVVGTMGAEFPTSPFRSPPSSRSLSWRPISMAAGSVSHRRALSTFSSHLHLPPPSPTTRVASPSDEDINTINTSTSPQVQHDGPITHARARQLNYQVSSFLSSYSFSLYPGDACTRVLLRNNGEDSKGRGFARGGFGLQGSANFWRPPRLHANSDLGVPVLHGKLIKSTFKWI